jgi:hypothetical protein
VGAADCHVSMTVRSRWLRGQLGGICEPCKKRTRIGMSARRSADNNDGRGLLTSGSGVERSHPRAGVDIGVRRAELDCIMHVVR